MSTWVPIPLAFFISAYDKIKDIPICANLDIWKKMIKNKKMFLIFIVAMTIGAFLLLININSQLEKISYEKESVSDDWLYYAGKKRECTGKANTTNTLVNGAGLTDCGGDLAVEAKLKIVSLSDIYHNYCNMGFGVAVYGCTIPLTRQVYVCMPGTTLYDRRNTYVSRYYIQYEYISYACNDVSISNTIRHELLHLVYFDLSESERAIVNSKLAKYEPQYASEIEPYSSSERAGELFVRVGADERKVDDMQLVDLYSKVSTAYTAQKQEYYKSLENVADEYIEKYEDLSDRYSALRVLVVILLVVNTVALVALAFSLRNQLQNNNKSSANNYKSKSTRGDGSESNGRNHECAACGASVRPGDTYCPDCGVWQGVSHKHKEVNLISKKQQEKKRGKEENAVPTIAILAFLIIILIICSMIYQQN